MRYHHTQIGWVSIIGIVFGMLLVVGLLWNAERIVVGPMVTALLVLIFLLGIAVFGKLTTSIDQNEFRIRFGWLGWPGKTVLLADIVGAIPTKTAPISGWGIRITTRGWLYNVSGRNAVIIATDDGKQFLVGSDESVKLADAINGSLGRPPVFTTIRGAGIPQQ
jgi:hypothetical protein